MVDLQEMAVSARGLRERGGIILRRRVLAEDLADPVAFGATGGAGP
jgi:hypothetical protein